jgi:hypothetical protein
MASPQLPESGEESPLNPAAVPVEQLARMLGLPMDDLRQHVAQGAPTNANGTINVVHYAAWLNTNTAQPGAPGGDND